MWNYVRKIKTISISLPRAHTQEKESSCFKLKIMQLRFSLIPRRYKRKIIKSVLPL